MARSTSSSMPPTVSDDPLRELRENLAATQAAAERLAGEAARARAEDAEGRIPPSGWATPEEHAERRDELQALLGLLEALRSLVPAELEAQLREVTRQVLLLVRAVVDWWLERVGPGAAVEAAPADPGARLQEIPID